MHPVSRRTAIGLAVAGLLAASLAGCQSGLTPEQIALLKQQGFELTDNGWEFGMSSKLLFGTNEATLAAGQRESIGELAQALLSVDIHRLQVEGHTDDYGTAEYNQQLSERRAQAVADALIAAGIPAQDLQVAGMGMSAPVEDNRSAAGRRENRRVAIIVSNQQ
ncbi:OmpA family protein [Inquilinus limosus]|uniref:OmpA family protein n=1 Tax=Inquilinus limosus TaxID=171674 RepID=UPI000419E857|nr:OmpA family protein [Inquilinus limosus]